MKWYNECRVYHVSIIIDSGNKIIVFFKELPSVISPTSPVVLYLFQSIMWLTNFWNSSKLATSKYVNIEASRHASWELLESNISKWNCDFSAWEMIRKGQWSGTFSESPLDNQTRPSQPKWYWKACSYRRQLRIPLNAVVSRARGERKTSLLKYQLSQNPLALLIPVNVHLIHRLMSFTLVTFTGSNDEVFGLNA